MQYIYANNLIHVGLIEQTVYNWSSSFWDTSIQGTQNLVPENVHIIFVFITSIKGTSDPIQRKGTFFLGSETWVYFNLHYFRRHLNTQKVTDHKEGWYL